MPVPSPRNPIRPARGLKADLNTNVADLYEGELCYALDEDQLYVVEGGTLTPIGSQNQGDVLVTDINSAQNGEALIYNGNDWTNGGPMDGGNF